MAQKILVIGGLASSLAVAESLEAAKKIGADIVVLAESRIAELEGEVGKFKVELSKALEDYIKEKSKTADQEATIESLKSDLSKALDAYNKEKEAHGQTQASSVALVNELKLQLSATEQKAEEGNASIEVKHGKETYQVALPKFKLDGIEYAAADLKGKPAVVEKLVKLGSAVLVKKQIVNS